VQKKNKKKKISEVSEKALTL